MPECRTASGCGKHGHLRFRDRRGWHLVPKLWAIGGNLGNLEGFPNQVVCDSGCMLERSRPGAPRIHRAESASSTPRPNLDQDQRGADPRLGHQGERLKGFAARRPLAHAHLPCRPSSRCIHRALRRRRPINESIFRAYVEQFLLPVLRRDDVVVLDNLGSRGAQSIGRAILTAGARLAFLPPLLAGPQADLAGGRQGQASAARGPCTIDRGHPQCTARRHRSKRMRQLLPRCRICFRLNLKGSGRHLSSAPERSPEPRPDAGLPRVPGTSLRNIPG
jgi:hypothetical protein